MNDLASSSVELEAEGPEAWSMEEAAAKLAEVDAHRQGLAGEDDLEGLGDLEDLDDLDDLENEDDLDQLEEIDTGEPEKPTPRKEDVDAEQHAIRIDGQEYPVTLGELKAGYQRQADYTRKTQTLAEERRQLQSERSQYQQVLGTISQTIAEGPSAPPDQSLLNADPVEYIRQSQQWQARQQVAGAAAREQERVQAQIEQEETANTVEQNLQQDYLLARSVPGWSDPTARHAGKAEIGDYLVRAYGATQDELNEFTDHRLVVLAHKALQYDKLMSKRNLAQKKVRSVPQVQAPGAARSKQEVDAATVKALRDQFHKSGSIDDAAKLMRYLGG
ncbi:MAG: hypothetical protein RIB43_13835 [Rhodospirillaceae bacterium]